MDEAQTVLLKHMALANAEQVISHLQGDIEYHKKIYWSLDFALKKEENNLKNLQAEYREEFKDHRSEEI